MSYKVNFLTFIRAGDKDLLDLMDENSEIRWTYKFV